MPTITEADRSVAYVVCGLAAPTARINAVAAVIARHREAAEMAVRVELRPYIEAAQFSLESEVEFEYSHTESQRDIARQIEQCQKLLATIPEGP